MVGTQLGRYRIIEQIGAGGMGVVYRARDERLDRIVAIKVLPPDTLADDVARRRFHKEAIALSKLNHPHITILYDFDSQGGTDFLVMEEVAGASIEARLAQGPFAESEAVAVGRQLADALGAAHENGILHRDLKPGNLRLTLDGRLKVLDFGLAQALRLPAISRSTASVSDYGPKAGTLAYMSPEQIAGKDPDARSDIYSAGTVLFEMTTGRHPFERESTPALIADVLHTRAAPARALAPSVSPELERIIGKCLEKAPDDRYQSARELAADLLRLERASSAAEPVVPALRHRSWPRYAAIAGVIGALAASLFLVSRLRRPSLPNPAQYVQLTNFADAAVQPALSPDGKMLTFLRGPSPFFSQGQVYVKLLPDGEVARLTNDNFTKMSPQFTPDGTRITYSTGIDNGVNTMDTWIVPVLGGQPRLMLTNAEGMTWSRDASGQPRMLYSVLTGKAGQMSLVASLELHPEPRNVYVPDDLFGMAHRSYLSPDGKWVIAVEMDATKWLPCRLVPFDGSSPGKPTGPAGQCLDAGWSPDGQWMYFTADTNTGTHIWRQRFPEGTPEQVTFGVTEEHGIHFSPDGRSFITSIGTSQSTVWVHDASGDRQITSEGFAYLPEISPDGTRVYYLVRASGARSFIAGTLWTADLRSGERQPLLRDFQIASYGISADGQRVVLVRVDDKGPSSIWVAPLNGRSAPRKVAATSNSYKAMFDATGAVIFDDLASAGMFVYRAKDDGSDKQKIGPPNIGPVSVSPDGKWFAAQVADPWGALRLYPAAGGEPVLVCPGCSPPPGTDIKPADLTWSTDGKWMYLKFSGSTYAIPLQRGQMSPPIPKGGFTSKDEVARLRGARLVSQLDNVYPGPDPSVFAFTKPISQRNIYRVMLP